MAPSGPPRSARGGARFADGCPAASPERGCLEVRQGKFTANNRVGSRAGMGAWVVKPCTQLTPQQPLRRTLKGTAWGCAALRSGAGASVWGRTDAAGVGSARYDAAVKWPAWEVLLGRLADMPAHAGAAPCSPGCGAARLREPNRLQTHTPMMPPRSSNTVHGMFQALRRLPG